MNEGILKFSQNWNNKLSCHCFTTIRKPAPKYDVGLSYPVYLQNKRLGTAELVYLKRFCIGSLTDGAALIDTGYTADEAYKILRNMHYTHFRQHGDKAPFYLLVFQWITKQKSLIE